jgi:hypothetical protein
VKTLKKSHKIQRKIAQKYPKNGVAKIVKMPLKGRLQIG